jgi:recombination protein RecT
MAEAAKTTNGNGKAAPPEAAKPAPAKQETQLQLIKRTVVDVVSEKVHKFIANGELNLPANYSVNNALKSAWLVLQQVTDKEGRKALDVCTRDSVANSLLDMIVQGLNVGKKQAYLIVYGKTLTCQRSYFGSMAVAQMVEPRIGEFAYAVVYEGDTFKYGIRLGKKMITEHEQDIKNVDKYKIVAAYCIALDKEGNPFRTEIMTFDEIKQAWRQSKVAPIDEKGKVKEGSTHGKFAADMALKTVINKCCKVIINASSDNALLLDRINRNDDLVDRAEAEMDIEENANKGEILDITPTEPEETEQEEIPDQPPEPNEPEPEAGTKGQPEEPKETKRSPGF